MLLLKMLLVEKHKSNNYAIQTSSSPKSDIVMALWAQGFQTTKRNKRVKHLLGPCRFTRQFFLQLTSPTSWPHNSRLPDEKKINSDGTVLSSLNSTWKIFLNLVWIFFWRRGGRTFFGTFHCRKPKGFVWWVLILALFPSSLKIRRTLLGLCYLSWPVQ